MLSNKLWVSVVLLIWSLDFACCAASNPVPNEAILNILNQLEPLKNANLRQISKKASSEQKCVAAMLAHMKNPSDENPETIKNECTKDLDLFTFWRILSQILASRNNVTINKNPQNTLIKSIDEIPSVILKAKEPQIVLLKTADNIDVKFPGKIAARKKNCKNLT